jgi:hypothetical protein
LACPLNSASNDLINKKARFGALFAFPFNNEKIQVAIRRSEKCNLVAQYSLDVPKWVAMQENPAGSVIFAVP